MKIHFDFRHQLYACLWSCGLLLGVAFAPQTLAAERLGTVEFKGATVGDAVRVLSEMSRQHNIVVTDEARAKTLSLYLKKASVESAVDAICRATGLWYRRDPDHGAYYIMTEEEFSKEIVVAKESMTRIFELKHQNVADAAHSIESLFGSRVQLTEPKENASYTLEGDIGGGAEGTAGGTAGTSNSNKNNNRVTIAGAGGRGGSSSTEAVEARREFFTETDLSNSDEKASIKVSESKLVDSRVRSEPSIHVTWNYLHNLLLVRTSDKQAVTDIEDLIKRIDRPAQQVLLEVQILRASLGDEERSIFDYAYQSGKGRVVATEDDDGNAETTFIPDIAMGLGNFPLEGGAFLAKITGSELNATIEWLRSENRVNLVSQPNIISANNKEAKLTIGEDRVIITGASSRVVTSDSATIVTFDLETEKRIIGTEMSIWPRINGDKTVTLDIEQSSTSLNEGSTNLSVSNGDAGGTTNIPVDSVTESTIELTAIARHGATIAIGGMIENEQQESKEKVPLLGDIPLLGKLFRKDYSNDARSELIVLITPWISEDPNTAHVINQKRINEWSDSDDIGNHLSTPESWPAQPEAAWPKTLQRRAMEAIQWAAGRHNGPDRSPCGFGMNESVTRFTDWRLGENLEVDAIRHCVGNGLVVTQARITNLSQRTQTLRPAQFNQGWIASSGESGTLEAGASRALYLVSTQSPEQLLQKQHAAFFYGEGALDAR